MSDYRFISRTEWGANPLHVNAGYQVPHAQFVGLVVHHTVIVMPDYDHDQLIGGDIDDICQYMRMLQKARPDLSNDVPYSFILFEGATPDDVIVAEGRGWNRTGAHTAGFNSTLYACCLPGDYTNRVPTPGQLAGIRWVGAQLADPTNARRTIGHRDVAATACPGDSTYPLLGQVQPPFTFQPSEEDMPLTADDLGAIWNSPLHEDGPPAKAVLEACQTIGEQTLAALTELKAQVAALESTTSAAVGDVKVTGGTIHFEA